MNPKTDSDFASLAQMCQREFAAKNAEYGPTWLLLRPLSLIDHILIKAIRVRTLEQPNHIQQIDDSVELDLRGIANYCAMGVAHALLEETESIANLDPNTELQSIDQQVVQSRISSAFDHARELMNRKNTDYGEVWRMMEPESITDEIIIRVHRMKTIARQSRNTSFSPLKEQLLDTLNYALFAVMRRAGAHS